MGGSWAPITPLIAGCGEHRRSIPLADSFVFFARPQSAKSGDALQFIAIEDLPLTCTVLLYAVAGRERSAVANGLIHLLRSADWFRLLPFRPEPAKPLSLSH